MQPKEELFELEQQRKRELLHETFQTEGWSELSELIKESMKALEDIRWVKDMDDLRIRQGKLKAYEEMLNLPSMIKQALNTQDAVDAV